MPPGSTERFYLTCSDPKAPCCHKHAFYRNKSALTRTTMRSPPPRAEIVPTNPAGVQPASQTSSPWEHVPRRSYGRGLCKHAALRCAATSASLTHVLCSKTLLVDRHERLDTMSVSSRTRAPGAKASRRTARWPIVAFLLLSPGSRCRRECRLLGPSSGYITDRFSRRTKMQEISAVGSRRKAQPNCFGKPVHPSMRMSGQPATPITSFN